MADITKCDGANCNKKDTCKRFTSGSGFRQSWFSESPIKNEKCEMYWGITQDGIFNTLKEIMK